MIKLFIKPINKLILLNKSIFVLNVESASLFRKISLNINENIIFSKNDIPEDLYNSSLILYNPFEINLNDSKNIKYLYKELEYEILFQNNELLLNVEKNLFELMDNLNYNSYMPLEYNLNIDINKLLSSVGLVYQIPETYIEKLVYYIKLYNQIHKNSIIISFGLLKLLEKDEIQILSHELMKINVKLMEINYTNKDLKYDLLVDNDWCVL